MQKIAGRRRKPDHSLITLRFGENSLRQFRRQVVQHFDRRADQPMAFCMNGAHRLTGIGVSLFRDRQHRFGKIAGRLRLVRLDVFQAKSVADWRS
ncbi:hypothetical protein N7E02_04425 (plasmid) [Aliirhizobium terrae]|uniref:hypothetical protein n=1 Tax=Terrirhizobium terrae TaxID=2926709 RepID=UPI002578F4AD|nr:hypothetical protein [Rhizobium sp. CC-CFT758]WJH38641.1 hypothetical protein N7E02_04425 [Rhizobium sp. CC-CFT758]